MTSITRAPSTISVVALTGQTDFNIPFDYLARKFVVVTLIGADRKVLTLNTDYRFVTKTTISLATSTPPGYDKLELRRVTDAARLVDFQDGSILRALDMNTAQIQALHIAEEARDVIAFDGMGINDEGNLDARSRRIVNVAFAVEDTDAVPLGQLRQFDNSALASANRAEAEADRAEGYRNDLETFVDNQPTYKDAFKKSVIAEIPFRFPDFDEAFAAVSGTDYIFPQGHCYDSRGNLLVRYARGNKAVIAWYTSSFAYGGYFLIEAGGESIVSTTKADGTVWLYSKGGSNRMYQYNITNIIAAYRSLLPFTDVGISGVGLQYAYENGTWLVEQIVADVGVTGSRTKWNKYNDAFQPAGSYFVSRDVVGWQLPSSPLYNYVPKTQGVCLKDGNVVFGLGGSYIPETDGPTSKPVSAIGTAVTSPDGSLVSYGVLKSSAYVSALKAEGRKVARMESEGLTLHPSGFISHLLVVDNPYDASLTSTGILIVKERDNRGRDYSSLAESYAPHDQTRLSLGVFPRESDGGINNPYTNVPITTLDALLRYMIEGQVPEVSWYTSAVTLTPLDKVSLPTGLLAKVSNANNQTFILSTTGATMCTSYSITYNSGTDSFTVTVLSLSPVDVSMGGFNSSGDVVGKLTLKHRTDTKDVTVISASSTSGGSLLSIGGGSSLQNAATRHWSYVGGTTTTPTGTLVTEVFTNGLNPGSDNAFALGSTSKRWSQLFAATGTINTSDSRMKTEPMVIPDELYDAIDSVDIVLYQWLDALRVKGEEARYHTGVLAQQIYEAFKAQGLDPFKYGLLCYDEWEDEYIEEEIEPSEEGEMCTVSKLHTPAGNRWGIRPDQCMWLLASAARRRSDKLEERLARLEQLLMVES